MIDVMLSDAQPTSLELLGKAQPQSLQSVGDGLGRIHSMAVKDANELVVAPHDRESDFPRQETARAEVICKGSAMDVAANVTDGVGTFCEWNGARVAFFPGAIIINGKNSV